MEHKLTQEPPAFDGLIGLGRRDISAPVGIHNRNWGAATTDVSTGNHQTLAVTAICLQEESAGSQPLILIAMDGTWWRRQEDEYFIRGAVLEALNLVPERCLINLSHTHAGPSMCAEDATAAGGELVPAYMDLVRSAVVSAAQEAVDSAVPASLEWSSGTCDLAVQRDLPEPGSSRYVVGYNPSGLPDQTLLVGRVTNNDGKILGTLVNYGCHPTTLAWQNTLVSPDFVGSMRLTIEEATQGAPTLFLQGFSGDLAPREQYTGDVRVAEAHGVKLGHAALATMPDWQPGTQLVLQGVQESGAPLAVWGREPRPRRTQLRATCKTYQPPLKEVLAPDTHPLLFAHLPENAREQILLRQTRLRLWLTGKTPILSPVWLWELGTLPVVAQEHEVYSRSGPLLRNAAGGPVLTLGLCNGGFAYLVPEQLYTLDIYPVRQTPMGPGALECFEALAVSHLKSLEKVK